MTSIKVRIALRGCLHLGTSWGYGYICHVHLKEQSLMNHLLESLLRGFNDCLL